MNEWKESTADASTNGKWWYVKSPKLTIKLWIPNGQKQWQASINGQMVHADTEPRGADRIIPFKRWSSLEKAKKELDEETACE